MKAPCQAVVWYLLPAMGAELTRELRKRGMTQKSIAKKLGLTPAAVSQYVKGKRGNEIKLTKRSLSEIKKLADRIMEEDPDDREMVLSVCEICAIARSEKVLCSLHREKSGLGKNCDICLAGRRERK